MRNSFLSKSKNDWRSTADNLISRQSPQRRKEINSQSEADPHPGSRIRGTAGFSTLEVAIVVVLVMVLAAFAIPQAIGTMRSLRAISDARNLASQLTLAKMRAADGFTQSRLNCNLTSKSCQLEICTSKGTNTCNTFTAEGGALSLSEGTSFGFGTLTTPAGSQATIQNSSQILFNSRSLPVDNSGAPTGNYALYLTNQAGTKYAVTVYATGRIAVWQYVNGAWSSQ